MRDFFRDRRRAWGVGVLAVACALAVGWIRSLFLTDSLTFETAAGDLCFSVTSTEGFLAFGRARGVWKWPSLIPIWKSAADFPFHHFLKGLRPQGYDVLLAYESLFGLGSIWSIWYGWLVLPLTLLAGGLLVFRPRRAKVVDRVSTQEP